MLFQYCQSHNPNVKCYPRLSTIKTPKSNPICIHNLHDEPIVHGMMTRHEESLKCSWQVQGIVITINRDQAEPSLYKLHSNHDLAAPFLELTRTLFSVHVCCHTTRGCCVPAPDDKPSSPHSTLHYCSNRHPRRETAPYSGRAFTCGYDALWVLPRTVWLHGLLLTAPRAAVGQVRAESHVCNISQHCVALIHNVEFVS